MKKKQSISVGQMFAMLFISRMVISMTYGTLLIGNSNLWDHLVSAPIAFLLTFLIILPICILFNMDKKMDVLDNSHELFGKFAGMVILIYVVYYLITVLHTLAIFNNFILNAVNPPISLTLLSALLLFSACYAAYKGLEAIARTSVFIILAMMLSFAFLSISLFSSIQPVNFSPLLYSGTESLTEGVIYMISQSACIPALALLLPLANGDLKKGIIIWNFGIYAVFSMIIILITGTMGDFASTQLFPVYTAAGIGKFGSFRHLDALYLAIWMSGVFLKLSLFLLLAGEGVKKVYGQKARKISVLIFGAVVAVVPIFYKDFKILHQPVVTVTLLVYLAVVAIVIPTLLIIIKKMPLKREKIRIEN